MNINQDESNKLIKWIPAGYQRLSRIINLVENETPKEKWSRRNRNSQSLKWRRWSRSWTTVDAAFSLSSPGRIRQHMLSNHRTTSKFVNFFSNRWHCNLLSQHGKFCYERAHHFTDINIKLKAKKPYVSETIFIVPH